MAMNRISHEIEICNTLYQLVAVIYLFYCFICFVFLLFLISAIVFFLGFSVTDLNSKIALILIEIAFLHVIFNIQISIILNK